MSSKEAKMDKIEVDITDNSTKPSKGEEAGESFELNGSIQQPSCSKDAHFEDVKEESEVDPLNKKCDPTGTELSVEDIDEDLKQRSFDRKCCIITVLLLLVFIGGLIAGIVINRFADRTDYTLKFSPYYTNNMVLQRAPYHSVVSGYGPNVDSNVTVLLTLHNGNKSLGGHMGPLIAGEWKVVLEPVADSGPFNLTVELMSLSYSIVTIYNIMFGEVWLCTGSAQLPSEEGLNASLFYSNFEKEYQVRVLVVYPEKRVQLQTVPSISIPWTSLADASTSDVYFNVPAVCLAYASKVQKSTGAPVGIVSAVIPGTTIEDWFLPLHRRKCNIQELAYALSTAYMATIHPLTSTVIRGVVWLQGLDDGQDMKTSYACSFTELISGWRNAWYERTMNNTDENLAFGITQAPPSDDKRYEWLSYIRWQQTANYGFVPNSNMTRTFLAETIDLPPEPSSGANQLVTSDSRVSDRLWLGARRHVYDTLSTIADTRPFPLSYSLVPGNRSLILFFGNPVKLQRRANEGFQVCCSYERNGSCSTAFSNVPFAPGKDWVNATIAKYGDRYVVLQWSNTDGICTERHVIALRYLWQSMPCSYLQCPLYDGYSDLPMGPYLRQGLKDGSHTIDKTPTVLFM